MRRRRLRDENGQALIEGLLALGLIVLVIAVGIQGFAYAHARSVAIAAAQDGADAAATDGSDAGTARADALLHAAGGVGKPLTATTSTVAGEVTVTVSGPPPRLFPLGLLVPNIAASASLSVEGYTDDEATP
jgi:Flp pilus assembly protein TadG